MAENKEQRQRRGREDWCSPAKLPETGPRADPLPQPSQTPRGQVVLSWLIRRILLFTPLLLVPVLSAPNSVSNHPLPVSPQLWLSQASRSWPSQRTSRLCWHPPQLGTMRGWGCAPCAFKEEPPQPKEGSSLGQHHCQVPCAGGMHPRVTAGWAQENHQQCGLSWEEATVRNQGVASFPHHSPARAAPIPWYRKLLNIQPPSCTRCDKHIQPGIPSWWDTAQGPHSQVTLQPPPTGSSLPPLSL